MRTVNLETNLAVLADTQTRRNPLLRTKIVFYGVATAVLLLLASRVAEVHPEVFFRASTSSALARFFISLFPLDFSSAFLQTVLRASGQTVAMAVAATLLSVVLCLPLAVLATGTLWNRGILVDASRRGIMFRAYSLASRLARAFLGFLRAVPELVWALLFVAAVGLGPLAGALALVVAYTGVLGRVYADVFEHVDPQPLEALQSTGASMLQIFLRGIWPQALPHLTAYTLYSFECCLRAAAVVGFVGAGGLGYEINISMRLFEYGQVATLLLAFVGLLAATDALSKRLRAKTDRLGKQTQFGPQPPSVILGAVFGASRRRMLQGVLLSIAAAASFITAGFTPVALENSGAFAAMFRFARNMMPPDLERSFLLSLGTGLLQTIAISFLGTFIGLILGVALSLPATSTLTLLPGDSPDRNTAGMRFLRWLLYWSARLVLNVLRSIPELVWVPICIVAVGIGPFAGTIALALHTTGVIGKLFAETMEEVPVRPVEALRALGARPLQILFWAVWPQARPMLSSYALLRWEMNLRASTILGLVGGGGLGQAIYNNVQLGFYPRVTTLILVIYALVLASDWASQKLRLSVG